MVLYQQFSNALSASLTDSSKIILAFSGGMDSRVLLRLLAIYAKQHPTRQCLAVHIHHGLSDNAERWLADCQRWASEEGITFAAERVQLSLGDRQSVEKAARDARYHALEQYVEAGDVLITGQHLDDQAETFLLALKRGSGPKGLSSMAEDMAWGKGRLVRPLLTTAQSAIASFAQQENLEWVVDESNEDTRFDRNFLRHEVMPVVNRRWPSFAHAVHRSARLCANQEALLHEILRPELDAMLGALGGLSISALMPLSAVKRDYLLRLWLELLSVALPSERQLQVLWQEVACAKDDANPELKLTSGSIRRFDGQLYWVANSQDVSGSSQCWDLSSKLPLPDDLGLLRVISATQPATMTLNRSALTAPVTVTFNPEGLCAHPQGRSGSRKMKKLYQEYRIPSWQRRRLPILMVNEKVVAVANLFVDKAFYGSDCELIWDK
ncbi:tRNA lysidine(34) synthetase TilS [Vibrio nomapromontoriensis]|uniref:tRNA lysidine(34) synthetase TilS n=1 Tax=Vibrio nomapromontoriensis TaxID=2910246 RepID=UPI003D111689